MHYIMHYANNKTTDFSVIQCRHGVRRRLGAKHQDWSLHNIRINTDECMSEGRLNPQTDEALVLTCRVMQPCADHVTACCYSEIITSASLMGDYDLNFITWPAEVRVPDNYPYRRLPPSAGRTEPVTHTHTHTTHTDPLTDSHSHSKRISP